MNDIPPHIWNKFEFWERELIKIIEEASRKA